MLRSKHKGRPTGIRFQWAKLLGCAATGAGLILCSIGIWFLFTPDYFQATVRIEIDRTNSFDPSNHTNLKIDPYWIQTEFGVILSEFILSKVIEDLNLNEAWQTGGRMLDTPETLRLLREKIDLRTPGGLIEIRVTDTDPAEAANLANAIATSYRDAMLKQQRERRSSSLNADNEKPFTPYARIVESAVPAKYPVTRNEPIGMALLLGGLAVLAVGAWLLRHQTGHLTREIVDRK